MSIAALITWVITIGFGSFMVRTWVTHGGLRQQGGTEGGTEGGTHFPAARVFTHLGLALAGLIIWISYLATDLSLLAWIAFGALVLVVVLGGLLVRRWTVDGRAAMATPSRPGTDLAEQHIGRLPVLLHGVFAITTIILVLLAALGVGAG